MHLAAQTERAATVLRIKIGIANPMWHWVAKSDDTENTKPLQRAP